MINFLTRVKVADNCGARVAQCIKLLGGSLPNKSTIGQRIVIVIKTADPLKKKIKIGSVVKALVIRTSVVFFRDYGV